MFFVGIEKLGIDTIKLIIPSQTPCGEHDNTKHHQNFSITHEEQGDTFPARLLSGQHQPKTWMIKHNGNGKEQPGNMKINHDDFLKSFGNWHLNYFNAIRWINGKGGAYYM